MNLKPQKALHLFTLVLILASLPVCAAQSEPVLRVGISPFSPFVILSPNGPSGISIDMWQAIAKKIGREFEYVECKGVGDKLQRLEQDSIDVAIGGITITEERETRFDFSHPVFETGLDILIPRVERTTFLGLVSSLFEGKKLVVFGGLLFLIVIAGHIIWLVERSSKERSTSFHRSYFPGVFEGMYWALITASTIGYGDKVPQRWVGRILAAIIILIALPLFGFFVAQLSSDLTMQSLKNSIAGPRDLRGRRVAVVDKTTSFHFMKEMPADVKVFQGVDDALNALLKGDVEAVVYDAPNLLYYANGEGQGKVTVVGNIFKPQFYGLAVHQGSPLREEINRAVLKLIELGEMERIKRNWVGRPSGS